MSRLWPGVNRKIYPGYSVGSFGGDVRVQTDINLVIEGHSFVQPEKIFGDVIKERVNYNGYYNAGVAGSTIQNIVDRAATVDSKYKPGKLNTLSLWIGVNDITNTAGSGSAAYTALKAYVQARLARGWSVFVYTCTPSTFNALDSRFEGERNTFNGLIRSDLANLQKTHIIDTDTKSEFSNPANTLYYSDLLHFTFLGTYISAKMFPEKLQEVYTNRVLPVTPATIPLTITSTGTGSGISQLTFTASEYTLATLTGNARFYTDAAATQNESTDWLIMPSSQRTIYIKCTSGTSNLTIEKDGLTQWNLWTSGTNAASIGGSISPFTKMTVYSILGNNSLSGSPANSDLSYLQISGNNTVLYNLTGKTKLTYVNMFGASKGTGDPSLCTLLNRLNMQGTGGNDASGSLTNLTLLNYLSTTTGVLFSGSTNGLTSLTQFIAYGTFTGDIAVLTNLQVCVVGSPNFSYSNCTNITGLCNLVIPTSVTLSSTNVNQILADFWLNRNTSRAIITRNIDLRGNAASGAPTGQGITDKTNLQSFVTPPGSTAWTVLTR